jgi:hypothetical protein
MITACCWDQGPAPPAAVFLQKLNCSAAIERVNPGGQQRAISAVCIRLSRSRISRKRLDEWWRGMLIGVMHAFFVLLVVMALLPGLHPRMASEQHGPAAQNLLEPPGLLALHYGVRTPLAIIISHAVFGAILGEFYRLK